MKCIQLQHQRYENLDPMRAQKIVRPAVFFLSGDFYDLFYYAYASLV